MHLVNVIIVHQIVSSLHIQFPAVGFFGAIRNAGHYRGVQESWCLVYLYTYGDTIYVVHDAKFLVLGTEATPMLSALRLACALGKTVNGCCVENAGWGFGLFSFLRSFPENWIKWPRRILLGWKCTDLSSSTRTCLKRVGQLALLHQAFLIWQSSSCAIFKFCFPRKPSGLRCTRKKVSMYSVLFEVLAHNPRSLRSCVSNMHRNSNLLHDAGLRSWRKHLISTVSPFGIDRSLAQINRISVISLLFLWSLWLCSLICFRQPRVVYTRSRRALRFAR